MDPDGDYESRHSIRSTASDACVNNPTSIDNDDVTSPCKIFAPHDDTKRPAAKSMVWQVNDYVGASAPPMEGAPPPPAAAASTAAAASSNGSAYDDMMGGKMDVTTTDEAPISNSVAVPIGFDSDDMALPEAKALPIISSTANEGTKMPPATLEEVDVNDTEAQVAEEEEEEPTPVRVPFSSNEDGSSTNPNATSERELDEQSGQDEKVPSPNKCTRKCKLWCCVALVFVAILGTVVGVLFGTTKGQLLLMGFPKCNIAYPSFIGDGYCDGRDYNTAECGWDGGDCNLYNSYPYCHVDWPHQLGDGDCDNYGAYNTAECGWDGGDCVEFNEQYPNCHVDNPQGIGNGLCHGGKYNTAECGWDGGDCIEFNEQYPDCHVDNPHWIGDGDCDGGEYNTAECGWDGGDCRQ